MKLLLALAIVCNLNALSQIGVITLKNDNSQIPFDMWYTINDEGRENQMYYTSDDAESAGEVLQKILYDLDIAIEDTIGTDEYNIPFWGKSLGNGYYTTIYLDHNRQFDLYTVTLLTEAE